MDADVGRPEKRGFLLVVLRRVVRAAFGMGVHEYKAAVEKRGFSDRSQEGGLSDSEAECCRAFNVLFGDRFYLGDQQPMLAFGSGH